MTIQKRIVYSTLLFFLFATTTNAQMVQLKWTAPVMAMDTNSKPVQALFFDGAQLDKNLLPHYVLNLYNTSAGNFTLVNPIYQPLTAAEQAIVQNKLIPPISVTVGVQNKLPVSIVSIVPLRQNTQTGTYDKLVSFSYQYSKINFSIPPAAPHKTNARAGNASAKMSTLLSVGSSVLASGEWYKISVNSTGLYKIDYNFLKTMGINPDAINPQNISIYGNGGGMLPQPNATSRADDLLENSIFVFGQADGKFDVGDYILFYAEGPDTWAYNTSSGIFNHTKNLYSDVSCYFLT
ncbi:MAG TPA: hypothetical protein VK766_08795, partial [Cytophagaceae bacterium]|nr:hypothetical protein [Cytophagaceae bacterium]